MGNGILVLCEHEGGQVKGTALELLGKARELAADLGGPVSALVIGASKPEGAKGADALYYVDGPDFQTYNTGPWTRALQVAVEKLEPKVVLGTSTVVTKDFSPRLAARLGLGLATEVVDLCTVDGQVVGRRPVYAGKALYDVRVATDPAMFTVRPNSFTVPDDLPAAPEAQELEVALTDADKLTTVLETLEPETDVVDLTEAVRIVSGGRGLKSKENFDSVIRPLAAAMGATPGASRAAVDAGYAPHGDQVGQTGKVVNPNLYVACGISGAIQHLAGMRTSKVIVAINKDEEAPIFDYATYGIVGDLFTICPLLQAEVEKLD